MLLASVCSLIIYITFVPPFIPNIFFYKWLFFYLYIGVTPEINCGNVNTLTLNKNGLALNRGDMKSYCFDNNDVLQLM